MITHAAFPKTLLYCFIGPLLRVVFLLAKKERRDLNRLDATVRWTVAGEGLTEPNHDCIKSLHITK